LRRDEVQEDVIYDDGWYRDQFRCSRDTFDFIENEIRKKWNFINKNPGHNTYFQIKERVAFTIHYLTHGGAIQDSAKVFGMSKTSAQRYLWEVIDVLLVQLSPEYLHLPRNNKEWMITVEGFDI